MNMYRKLLLSFAAACLAQSPVFAEEIVVIGSPQAASLTKSQVEDVFLGRSASLSPVEYPATAPIRADFYNRATGRSVTQVKTIWARLIFSASKSTPRELPDAAAVKKAVAADPNLIGYVEKSAVDSTVKVLLPLN